MIIILVDMKWYGFDLHFLEGFDLHFPQGRMDSSWGGKKSEWQRCNWEKVQREKRISGMETESELLWEVAKTLGLAMPVILGYGHGTSLQGPSGKGRAVFVCGSSSHTILPAYICIFNLIRKIWMCLLLLPTHFPTQSTHPCYSVTDFAFPFPSPIFSIHPHPILNTRINI